jgi:hypothetical protein
MIACVRAVAEPNAATPAIPHANWRRLMRMPQL